MNDTVDFSIILRGFFDFSGVFVVIAIINNSRTDRDIIFFTYCENLVLNSGQLTPAAAAPTATELPQTDLRSSEPATIPFDAWASPPEPQNVPEPATIPFDAWAPEPQNVPMAKQPPMRPVAPVAHVPTTPASAEQNPDDPWQVSPPPARVGTTIPLGAQAEPLGAQAEAQASRPQQEALSPPIPTPANMLDDTVMTNMPEAPTPDEVNSLSGTTVIRENTPPEVHPWANKCPYRLRILPWVRSPYSQVLCLQQPCHARL